MMDARTKEHLAEKISLILASRLRQGSLELYDAGRLAETFLAIMDQTSSPKNFKKEARLAENEVLARFPTILHEIIRKI